MSSNFRRFAFWTTSALLAAAAIYAGAWFLIARQVETLSEQWIETQRRQGWTVSYQPMQVRGFPSWPQIELKDVQVAAPLSDGGWVWTAETATVVPLSLDLTQFSVLTPGRQTFRAPGQDGAPWTITAFTAVTKLGLDSRRQLQSTDLTFGDLELLDPGGLPVFGAARLNVALGLADGPSSPDMPYARFVAAADAIRLAADTRPFSRSIPALRLDVDMLGAMTPGRLSDALDDWREDGGTLEVRRFLLDWPPLRIDADGTLALDQDLQPIAAFSTRISGFNETLDALVADGRVSAGDAQSATLILNLLAQRPDDGGAPEIAVPVSVQDRRLSVGPIEVMDVPEVRWD